MEAIKHLSYMANISIDEARAVIHLALLLFAVLGIWLIGAIVKDVQKKWKRKSNLESNKDSTTGKTNF